MAPPSTSGQPTQPVPEPQLRRVLTLWDLVFYGIVLIQPIAAVPLFGIADKLSRGHVVTTILIAMIAMMLTAFSYGRMATAYPAAGSAYVYVGRELNPHLGFLTGWAMMLDYLVIPIINTIYGALTLARLFPAVPYIVWAAIIAALTTYLNLRGIRSTARTNIVLLVVMCAVIVAFLILAVHYLVHADGVKALFSLHPFYDPGNDRLLFHRYGDFPGGVDLHWIRRGNHPLGRSARPQTQHSSGYRAGVFPDGSFQRDSGVPCPARLAGFLDFSQSRDGLHGCVQASGRSGAFRRHGIHPGGGLYW